MTKVGTSGLHGRQPEVLLAVLPLLVVCFVHTQLMSTILDDGAIGGHDLQEGKGKNLICFVCLCLGANAHLTSGYFDVNQLFHTFILG